MHTPNKNDLTDASYWSEVWGKRPPNRRQPTWLRKQVKALAARHSKRLFSKLTAIAGCPNGDLLEIGCGSGIVLEQVHRACPTLRLHGIDFSQVGVLTARERLAAVGINASIEQGDVFQATVQERYDIVLSAGLIEHFEDPLAIVKCHRKLCRPGGHVILLIPNFASPISKFFHQKFGPRNLAIHNLSTLNTKRLQELMEQAGLTNIKVGKSGPPRLYDGADPGRPFGRVYVLMAKIWNIVVYILPFPRLWHAEIWAIGRAPAEG